MLKQGNVYLAYSYFIVFGNAPDAEFDEDPNELGHLLKFIYFYCMSSF